MAWERLQVLPTGNFRIAVTVVLICGFAVVVCIRLAAGEKMPDGYDTFMIFLAALAGIDVTQMWVKRSTDHKLNEIKAGKTQPVTVESTTTEVNVTNAAPSPPVPIKVAEVVKPENAPGGENRPAGSGLSADGALEPDA